jgi:dTMP kinase
MPPFISFEGPDGGGKSTQARLLAADLRDRGHRVTETREPGGTVLGERLRTLILDPASPPAGPLVMALLLSASRAQLVETVIRPARERGEIVIVDRWADSTTAYQGFGLGLDRETIRSLRNIATGGLEPDFTVLVDVPPQVGLERISARGSGDKLDAQTIAFHERVRAGYKTLYSERPDRWIWIDGTAPREKVHCDIVQKVLARVERAQPS